MDESLWSEKTCCSLVPCLPLWIIEYAWSNRMTDVLEVLGPPLWLEGDWGCLSLQDPYSIRVVAAEAWMVIRARDIKHFERVMKFLDVTYMLLPKLVTSIKHMKIMFGLKSLVIMWMLWDEQNLASITDKITRFFPDNLPQYHKSSHKHKKLMQKTQQDFSNFALSLAKNRDKRKTYIKTLLEDQYGECYAQKLEERLFHYLEELDKALPQPTCIDQVLKRSWQLGESEELLRQLLTCKSTSMSTVLKRLLRCAMTDHSSHDVTGACKPERQAEAEKRLFGPLCIAFTPSQENGQEMMSQASSQGSWLNRDKRLSLPQKGTEMDEAVMRLKQMSDLRPEISRSDIGLICVADEPLLAGQQKVVEPPNKHLCSRHGKKMKSILQECSEELQGQDKEVLLAHSNCTPPSPHTPILQSTPQRLTHSSASPLEDSSSTNISLFSQPDSSATYLSGAEAQERLMHSSASPLKDSSSTNISELQQINPSQPSSGQQVTFTHMSPVKQNISATSSSFAKQVSPSPLSSSLHQITASPASSVQPSLSVQQESSSPVFSVQSHLLQMSSSLVSPSEFPVNKSVRESAATAHAISPSPRASSVQGESSSPVCSIHEINSPASLGHHPCSGETRQDLATVFESNSVLKSKLKLSLATQGFFLQCKWMQPQVLLCRLSQQDCVMTSQPEGATVHAYEEEEEEGEKSLSFDLNLPYSDSESCTQDSDDSDYIPSKRLKRW